VGLIGVHYPQGNQEDLVVLDPSWTPNGPRKPIVDTTPSKSIVYIYVLLGFGFGGPGEIRTHDLFHAI